MHVLIIYPSIDFYGGGELVVVKLANFLSEQGIESTVLTTSIVPEVEREIEGSDVVCVEEMSPRLFDVGKFRALWTYMRRHISRWDVVNVHNYPSELCAFMCKKPVVWMCNEPPRVHLRYEVGSVPARMGKRLVLAFDRHVARHYIDEAVVADEFNAQRFMRLYGKKPHIVHYGIECSLFERGDGERMRERLGLGDGFVAVQVGMLTPYKNQMESIRCVEALRDRIPSIRLVLAGKGDVDYEQGLREYVKERGLEGRVVFCGHVSREVVRDLYHACDVALFPVRSQGSWLSPFEALCAGVPIVVSPDMTASSIIQREGIGVVTESFEEAVWHIYSDPERYRRMAERGRQWVREHLSWKRFGEGMLAVFERAMHRNY